MSTFQYRVARVLRVVDGDTVDLELDLGFHLRASYRFRLLGIDTPDRGDAGYVEAGLFLTAWLTEHQGHVVAETHKSDSFGRWLVRLTAEGVSVADELLDAGLASPYRT